MKFHFCGDGDCPDWVLAEIHSTLSVLSSIKLRVLAQTSAKIICGEEIVEDKIRDVFTTSKMDANTSKSAISCLRFLLISATKNNVSENIFEAELQQIGLPKEHSSVICRVFSEYSVPITTKLLASKLTVNELENISMNIPNGLPDCIQLQLKIKNEIIDGVLRQESTSKINVFKTTVKLLLDELKAINNIMSTYNSLEK